MALKKDPPIAVQQEAEKYKQAGGMASAGKARKTEIQTTPVTSTPDISIYLLTAYGL